MIATAWWVAVGGTAAIVTVYLLAVWALIYAFFGEWKWWD